MRISKQWIQLVPTESIVQMQTIVTKIKKLINWEKTPKP